MELRVAKLQVFYSMTALLMLMGICTQILKDIINRKALLNGSVIEYRPGWDCHGLPIELKCLQSSQESSSAVELRKNCLAFARKFVEIQREEFSQWSLLGIDRQPYLTVDGSYQSMELRAFSALYEKGYILRSLYPVFWSPASNSALSMAELEYKDDHISLSIYLAFNLEHSDRFPDGTKLVIWTTTPWTLVANQAVAYSSDINYLLIQSEIGEHFIIGSFFLDKFSSLLPGCRVVRTFPGSDLANLFYRSSINKTTKPLLVADFVLEDKGTGLVHVAPCHGRDDFFLGIKHQLPLTTYVNERGLYTEQAGPPLQGLDVLGEGTKEALNLVKNDVLLVEEYKHSFPYDWRSFTPVITRLSQQWFVDTAKIAPIALQAYEKVKVYPAQMKNSMLSYISNRPNWCISRQRSWGVPIPVLFTEKDKPIVDHEFIDYVANRVQQTGTSDFWFSDPIEELVPRKFLDKWSQKYENLTRGSDIFDVWFDSGLSWKALHEGRQADLCLEGVDQFRGWFSSSLLLSSALNGQAPFKKLVVHGFAVDGEGNKMSKSLGNVVDPFQLLQKFDHQTDILRIWVAKNSLGANCPISEAGFEEVAAFYKNLKNKFRFITGNLYDLRDDKFSNYLNEYSLLDRAWLHQISTLVHNGDSEKFPTFREVEQFIERFSNHYITSVKDQLYCDPANSKKRLQRQLVFSAVLEAIKYLLAPLMPNLIDRTSLLEGKNSNSYFEVKPNIAEEIAGFKQETINSAYWEVVEVKQELVTLIQKLKVQGPKTNPLARIHLQIHLPKQVDEIFENFIISDDSKYILRCASVNISQIPLKHAINKGVSVDFQLADQKEQCPRCRLYSKPIDSVLCIRCQNAIQ